MAKEILSQKGKLIVFEGACDGIGKSTQLSLLKNHFQKDGYQIISHHFPSYGTYHGAPVEHYLSGDFGKTCELSPYFIHSLYAQDRAITWHNILKKSYEEGKYLLLDRYTTSSIIYQSALIDDINEKKRFINFVVDYEYNKLGIQQPDNVIFLYAPFELVTKMRIARKNNAGVVNDIHERDLELMNKFYENAMFVSDYLAWDKIKCNDGDNMRDPADINKEVYNLVKKK